MQLPKSYDEVLRQTAQECQTSKVKIEEAANLLFQTMRYYISNPHLASRIVVTYFGVFDLNWKMCVKILQVTPIVTPAIEYIYSWYKRYWK